PDLDGPGLNISGRPDVQENRIRRLAGGDRERAWAGAVVDGGGAGIAGAPPRTCQENEQQKRAGHTRYAAGGGEREGGSVGSAVSTMSRERHRGPLRWPDPAPGQPRAPSL